MAGITYTDIEAITGSFLTIGLTTDKDYTPTKVAAEIQRVVRAEFFPVFRSAGYQVPSTYPLADFSTDTAENLEIDQNLALLVAYRLTSKLNRYAQTLPRTVEEWGETVLGYVNPAGGRTYGWLDKVRKGWIKFNFVTEQTTRTAMSAPHFSDTTVLFPDADNGAGTESNVDEWDT